MYFFFIVPLAIIGGVVVLVFSIRHYRKIPSPEESEEALFQLKKEIEKWRAEGIIEESQAERILGRYLAFKEKREEIKRRKLIKILSTFGAILAGIGVILLIAANWKKIPAFLNAAILIGATAGVYFGGWWFKYEKKSHPKLGGALILLGAILFGASLILISQLYHIRIEFSNLLLVWALGVLPLGWLTRSSVVLALASGLTFGWGFFSVTGGGTRFFDFIIVRPPVYLSFILLLGLFVPLSYYLKFLRIQKLNIIELLVLTGIMMVALTRKSSNPLVDFTLLFLALGAFIFILGEIHSRFEKYREFKNVYYSIGLLLVFITSLILTFPQFHEFSRGKSPLMPILFNFVLFGEICGAIYLGIKKEEESFINKGIVFFGILIFARYFSLSWSLGTRAFVFIIGGILLIGISYVLGKIRKKIIQKMKE